MEGEQEPETMGATTLGQVTLLPTRSHQYQAVLSDGIPSGSSVPRDFSAPVTYSNKASLTWKPFYLRRVVLLGFIFVFILLIVAIELLLAISNKNSGIATGRSAEHYLWTYGPTAFLTVVAAVWARTEYQSKLVAPWIHLAQNRQSKHAVPASRTLLLDYISQFSIFALVSSLHNRDFTVFITLTVSILIKVLIVLSSGLISLQLANVTRGSYPMVLESKFVDSNAKLNTTGNLAWYVMTGLGSQNLTFPEGISSEYAFQSVQAKWPDNTLLETRVTTDGLKSSLKCDVVDLRLLGAQYPDPHYTEESLNVTISSRGCNVALARLPGIAWPGTVDNSTLFARFQQVRCDAVNGDGGKRLLVLFGNLTYYTDTSRYITTYGPPKHPVFGVLNKSTQLFCLPTYTIDKIEVIHNGIETKRIMPVQGGASRVLESVTAWNIMEAQFQAGKADFRWTAVQEYGASINVSMVPVDIDVSMETALKYFFPPESQATTLFDPVVLQDTAEAYYRQISAIVSKESLMEPASDNVFGSITFSENRLTIHSSVAQSMVGLLGACILLTAVGFFIVPTHGFLPHSPSTFLCSISLFLYSRDLLSRFRYAGASDKNHFARWLRPSTFESGPSHDSVSGESQFRVDIDTKDGYQIERHHQFPQISSNSYHPIILHPVSRSLLCLSVVGLIISLELLLRKSNLEYGLGNVNNDDTMYRHYAWTVIPAIVFGALSITYSAVDFQIRTLAPYMGLKGYASKDIFTRLELLDMTIPVAIYHEFKFRNPWALATTVALFFASLFTTLSASLFQELAMPSTTSILLQASQSFDFSRYLYDDEIAAEISSLILEGNLSFPRYTFSDLAFPQFIPVSNLSEVDTHFNASTVSISTMVPSVRGRMDCRSYEPARIHTNITLDQTRDGFTNPLYVSIDGEDCSLVYGTNFEIETWPLATYVGQVLTLRGEGQCSDLVYLWGKIDYDANPVIQHIDAMSCNITFETVDVNTTFIGTDLNLDFRNPPQPLIDSTAQHTINIPDNDSFDINYAKTDSYARLAEIDVSPQILDTFFATLVTSSWAIPMSALGDPSASARVAAAIKFQHGIIQAQSLSRFLAPANETNVTIAEPISPGDNDAQPRYNATVTNPAGRRRVVQDAASTHILVALLAVTLVLFIIGWAGNPGTDVLPRSPTTIASVAALIAGGNLLAYLPSHAQSLDDIAAALGGPKARFWLGWGNLPDEEGRISGGENEAGVSQFGIFVVDEEETTSK